MRCGDGRGRTGVKAKKRVEEAEIRVCKAEWKRETDRYDRCMYTKRLRATESNQNQKKLIK